MSLFFYGCGVIVSSFILTNLVGLFVKQWPIESWKTNALFWFYVFLVLVSIAFFEVSVVRVYQTLFLGGPLYGQEKLTAVIVFSTALLAHNAGMRAVHLSNKVHGGRYIIAMLMWASFCTGLSLASTIGGLNVYR